MEDITGPVSTSIQPTNSLTSEELAFELIQLVSTPEALLGLNSGLAHQGAIYRLRTIHDCNSNSDRETGSFFDSRKNFDSGCSQGEDAAADFDINDSQAQQNFHSLRTPRHGNVGDQKTQSIVSGSIRFADHLILYIKNFADLKTLDDELAEKQSLIRFTILPHEPLLRDTSVKELEDMTMNNFPPSQFTSSRGTDLISCNEVDKIDSGSKEFDEEDFDYDEEYDHGDFYHQETLFEQAQQERQSLKTHVLRNETHRETTKQNSSNLYHFLKMAERKLRKGNGKLAKFLQARQEEKLDRLVEEMAWYQGPSAWRLSMLNQEWWISKGCNPKYYMDWLVWNHGHFDLAPEGARDESVRSRDGVAKGG